MFDLSDRELLAYLIFDILALAFAAWWLSGRVRSKLKEVDERKSRRWKPDEIVTSEDE